MIDGMLLWYGEIRLGYVGIYFGKEIVFYLEVIFFIYEE